MTQLYKLLVEAPMILNGTLNKALSELKKRLTTAYPVVQLILFGSAARGEMDEESDVDVLVLTKVPLDGKDQDAIVHDVFEINLLRDTNISVLITDVENWERGALSVLPIRKEIEREGILLHFDGSAPWPLEAAPERDGRRLYAMTDGRVRSEVVRHWWKMAQESLQSAKRELEAGAFHVAVNRAYYTLFYAASAALLERGLEFKRHSGVRASFHREFIKPGLLAKELGALYDRLFKNRQYGDYVALWEFKPEYVKEEITRIEAFLTAMRPLIETLEEKGNP